MTERLILLPGWCLGSLPLDVLAEALRGLDPALRVEIEPLPELRRGEPRDWLLELDERLPPHTWLGGWSLGGLLASGLAALRGEGCRGLLTLASNPRFVAGGDWPYGMDEASFDAFVDGCRADPDATLRRFSLLCAQGAAEARSLARQCRLRRPAPRRRCGWPGWKCSAVATGAAHCETSAGRNCICLPAPTPWCRPRWPASCWHCSRISRWG